MNEKTLALLKECINTISPSGFEDNAAKLWKDQAKAFADEVHGDRHGNSFAIVNKGGNPKVMLASHVDEIGVMISQITDEGYLFFTTIGSWDNQVLPGQRVQIHGKNKTITGVVGRKPMHLMEDEDKKKVVKPEDLWIDIGVSDKQEADGLVEVGSPGVLVSPFERLQGNIVAARGFDNKSGVFVVLEAARKLADLKIQAEVHVIATVQEEVGPMPRGAITSAYDINADVGIAVDVGWATDTPMMNTEKRKVGETKLGGGPILSRALDINPVLLKKMKEVAEANDIPYQVVGAPSGTGTDAYAIQLTRSGVATGLISIPNRYMHSPCELVSLTDLDNSINLVVKTVEGIHEENFELF